MAPAAGAALIILESLAGPAETPLPPLPTLDFSTQSAEPDPAGKGITAIGPGRDGVMAMMPESTAPPAATPTPAARLPSGLPGIACPPQESTPMPRRKTRDRIPAVPAECPAGRQEISSLPAVPAESASATVHCHPACAAAILLTTAGSGRTPAPAASDPDCNALRSAADSPCHCA